MSDRYAVTAERVLEELAYVAFGRITDVQSFEDAGSSIRSSESLPSAVAAAIAEVRVSESIADDGAVRMSRSVKMHNKATALSLLARYFGIDSDFNRARQTMKAYGIALIEDDRTETGWRLAPHIAGEG